MTFEDIREFVDCCRAIGSDEVSFCDAESFADENIDGAAPGGFLNPFGYFVIGTTIGGNAVVVGETDPRVCFADHEWYDDEEISYQDLAGDRQWRTVPRTAETVRDTLFELATTREQFLASLRSGAIDRTLGPIG